MCSCLVYLSHPIFFNIWCTCYRVYVFFIFLLIYYSLFLCSHHNILRIFSNSSVALSFFPLDKRYLCFHSTKIPDCTGTGSMAYQHTCCCTAAFVLSLFFLHLSVSLCHTTPPSSVSYILLFPVLARNDPPEFTESLSSLSRSCVVYRVKCSGPTCDLDPR